MKSCNIKHKLIKLEPHGDKTRPDISRHYWFIALKTSGEEPRWCKVIGWRRKGWSDLLSALERQDISPYFRAHPFFVFFKNMVWDMICFRNPLVFSECVYYRLGWKCCFTSLYLITCCPCARTPSGKCPYCALFPFLEVGTAVALSWPCSWPLAQAASLHPLHSIQSSWL